LLCHIRDGGRSWRPAELGPDHGRFSWRQWTHAFKADRVGPQVVRARASNRLGHGQPMDLIFNPAGYHNNVVQQVAIQVS
jgi:hypothetical protein